MESVLASLGMDQNPYFSAGFGLSALGAAVAIARKGSVQAMYLIRKR